MPHLLGLDIGTSGAKALLCDERGAVLATALAEYPLHSPQPLWSEQNPADWWRGAQSALRAVIAQANVAPDEIVGLGLTGQMHGSVFLDADDAVIRPALLWNDQRTAAECAEITAKVGERRLLEIAGNPALTGFQAPKIVWLRNHEPEHFARVRRVLLPKDYIRLLLTGEYATDASDAAGTLLLDLRARNWSDEILGALAIPREWLPRVYEGPDVTGRLLTHVAAEMGLPAGLPVVAGGGDNAAAAVGTGIIRPGVLSSSIGTSGVLFAHSDALAFDPQGRLHTFCHAVPGKYHLMGVTLAAGGSLRWLRDVLTADRRPQTADRSSTDGRPQTADHSQTANDDEHGGQRSAVASAASSLLSYDVLAAEAATVPVGAEGLLFLPYLTGERSPHLDPLARGAFVGLTSRHTRAHLIRAVMEGVAFSLRDSFAIMRELGVPLSDIRATGGGGKSALWRQMQADIYNAPVVQLRAEEGPAYGAALLAGVGAGIFPSVEAAADAAVAVAARTEPSTEAAARYEHFYGVYRTLYGSLREAMHALGNLAG